MSTRDNVIYRSKEIISFYRERLSEHGNSSKGVGWRNNEAQTIRFIQLAKVFSEKSTFSVNDFGCGTGEFYNFLLAESFSNITYCGYDILGEMIDEAKKNLQEIPNVRLSQIESPHDLVEADYSVASGVFNVKFGVGYEEWSKYITSTLDVMFSKSKKGFSFNILTSYSDRERMEPYLYYGNPLFFFDYCKMNYSKKVALLHDYDLFDFTIIVRKN